MVWLLSVLVTNHYKNRVRVSFDFLRLGYKGLIGMKLHCFYTLFVEMLEIGAFKRSIYRDF